MFGHYGKVQLISSIHVPVLMESIKINYIFLKNVQLITVARAHNALVGSNLHQARKSIWNSSNVFLLVLSS